MEVYVLTATCIHNDGNQDTDVFVPYPVPDFPTVIALLSTKHGCRFTAKTTRTRFWFVVHTSMLLTHSRGFIFRLLHGLHGPKELEVRSLRLPKFE